MILSFGKKEIKCCHGVNSIWRVGGTVLLPHIASDSFIRFQSFKKVAGLVKKPPEIRLKMEDRPDDLQPSIVILHLRLNLSGDVSLEALRYH